MEKILSAEEWLETANAVTPKDIEAYAAYLSRKFAEWVLTESKYVMEFGYWINIETKKRADTAELFELFKNENEI